MHGIFVSTVGEGIVDLGQYHMNLSPVALVLAEGYQHQITSIL